MRGLRRPGGPPMPPGRRPAPPMRPMMRGGAYGMPRGMAAPMPM